MKYVKLTAKVLVVFVLACLLTISMPRDVFGQSFTNLQTWMQGQLYATFNSTQFNVGTPGGTAGSIVVANATSGTITISPPTGALGTPTLTLPAEVNGSIPYVINCGSTGSGNQTCANAAVNNKMKIFTGQSTLSSNSAIITFPASTAFTSTTSYSCVANDVTTRANPVQMVPTNGTSATITNTTGATDVIQWMCSGS